MGIKYGSLHIKLKENNMESLLGQLKPLLTIIIPNRNIWKSYLESPNLVSYQMHTERDIDKFRRWGIEKERTAGDIVVKKNMVSIYSEEFSFESIADDAVFTSKHIDEPVLYVSNFDEDVFLMGLAEKGAIIARKNCLEPADIEELEEWLKENEGSTKEDYDEEVNYGIEAVDENISLIWEYLGGKEPKKDLSHDISGIQSFVRRALKAPLKMRSGEAENQPGKYELMEKGEGYSMYKYLEKTKGEGKE